MGWWWWGFSLLGCMGWTGDRVLAHAPCSGGLQFSCSYCQKDCLLCFHQDTELQLHPLSPDHGPPQPSQLTINPFFTSLNQTWSLPSLKTFPAPMGADCCPWIHSPHPLLTPWGQTSQQASLQVRFLAWLAPSHPSSQDTFNPCIWKDTP